MNRFFCVAIILTLPFVCHAESKPLKKPQGTFVKEGGDQKVTMTFKDDQLTVLLGEGELKVEAAFSVTGEVVFGSIIKVEKGSDGGGPSKRDLFSFEVKMDKSEMTVSDLRGTHTSDESKRVVEGNYKQQK